MPHHETISGELGGQPPDESALPPRFGPYSRARRIGNLLQVSGQVGLDPRTSASAGDSVDAQTRQALRNVAAILRHEGAAMADVLMLRVYLVAPEYFPELNDAFEAELEQPYPARTTVFGGLPPGVLVEIDALAVVDA